MAGPPQKKGMSGCVIALLVVGVLLFVACMIGGVAMWRVSQSEEGKKVFTALGKGVQMAQKGLNAPGTPELRQAGCPQAIVLEAEDVMGVVEIFVDGGDSPGKDLETMVLCQGQVFDSLPACDELATTYARAVRPTKPFSVSVQKQGNNKPICRKRYDADGSPLER